MKALFEIVELNVTDVVTASSTVNPNCPNEDPNGDAI